MIGAWGNWGDEEPRQKVAPEEVISALLPAVSLITAELSDPYRRVELLKVKIQQARARGASPDKIARLEAKLRAAERNLGLRTETEESHREFSGLGKTGIMVGIGVGVALIALLLAKAVK